MIIRLSNFRSGVLLKSLRFLRVSVWMSGAVLSTTHTEACVTLVVLSQYIKTWTTFQEIHFTSISLFHLIKLSSRQTAKIKVWFTVMIEVYHYCMVKSTSQSNNVNSLNLYRLYKYFIVYLYDMDKTNKQNNFIQLIIIYNTIN